MMMVSQHAADQIIQGISRERAQKFVKRSPYNAYSISDASMARTEMERALMFNYFATRANEIPMLEHSAKGK